MKNLKNMMKKGLALAMVAVLALTLAGCGSKTLESVIEKDSTMKSRIEEMSASGYDVSVEDNTVIYTYQYENTFDEEVVNAMKSEIEKVVPSLNDIYESMIDGLEKDTEIDGISVKVVYKNGDGSTIYEKEFK